MEKVQGEIVGIGSTGIDFNNIEITNRIRKLIDDYNDLTKDIDVFTYSMLEDKEKVKKILELIKEILAELKKVTEFDNELTEQLFNISQKVIDRYDALYGENIYDTFPKTTDFIDSYNRKERKKGNLGKTDFLHKADKSYWPTDKDLQGFTLSFNNGAEIYNIESDLAIDIDRLIESVNEQINEFNNKITQSLEQTKKETTTANNLPAIIPQKQAFGTSISGFIIDSIRSFFRRFIKSREPDVVAAVDYKEETKKAPRQGKSFIERLPTDGIMMNITKNKFKSNFTFLTKEQCFGKDKLNIFKKRGTRALITDFAILLGGIGSDIYVRKDSNPQEMSGMYLTKSNYSASCDVVEVCVTGEMNESFLYDDERTRRTGARPVLSFSSINSIPTNGENVKRAEDGILEVEYGYYPQKAVDIDMQNRLESEFQHGRISRTKNTYTTDTGTYGEEDKKFKPKRHQEYEYNGRRYIRVEAEPNICSPKITLMNGEQLDGMVTLSNCKTYQEREPVWLEVLPVKWLVDEEAKIMVTEKILFAGVQFKYTKEYRTENFEETNMYAFMNTHFSRDLLQLRSRDDRVA